MEQNSEKIKTFIANNLLVKVIELKEDDSLFKSGLLSSLDLVSLLDFIEKEFKIVVPPEDVDFDNLDSIIKISSYLKSR